MNKFAKYGVYLLVFAIVISIAVGINYYISSEENSRGDEMEQVEIPGNAANETFDIQKMNISQMIEYLNDPANITLQDLVYARETVTHMYVTGIVSNVTKDSFGLMDEIIFAKDEMNLTTINAGDFPYYPGKVHHYVLRKVQVDNSSYFHVEDVRFISNEQFLTFYRNLLVNDSEFRPSMNDLVFSLENYEDDNVSIEFNSEENETVITGKVEKVYKKGNSYSCFIIFKGGFKVKNLNGYIYQYYNDTEHKVVIEEIESKGFTFFNVKDVSLAKGS
ncbi:MAG: hypothetical protein KAQ64_03480 [Candidatus Pacebacteria bacterium]|nr:hypothetical protein [Candidatus Paceibacterota bacterium]